MNTYRIVPEAEWRNLLDALDRARAALEAAGTVSLPGSVATAPIAGNGTNQPEGNERLAKAREVIERVRRGGERHSPKPFDKVGPKIADFVYLVMDAEFEPPDAIEPVSEYVELKESRRDAGGQIRTAIKNDDRFRQLQGGAYIKIP